MTFAQAELMRSLAQGDVPRNSGDDVRVGKMDGGISRDDHSERKSDTLDASADASNVTKLDLDIDR
jgi:hypothetical protein